MYTRHYMMSDGATAFAWGSAQSGAVVPAGFGGRGLYVLNGQTNTMTYCSSASTCVSGSTFAGDGSQPSDQPVGVFAALGSTTGVSTEATSPYNPVTNTVLGGYSIGFGLNSSDITALASAWFGLMNSLGRFGTQAPPPPMAYATTPSIAYGKTGTASSYFVGPSQAAQRDRNAFCRGFAAVSLRFRSFCQRFRSMARATGVMRDRSETATRPHGDRNAVLLRFRYGFAHEAVVRGDAAAVVAALDAKPTVVATTDEEGNATALMLAAERGFVDVARAVLRHPAAQPRLQELLSQRNEASLHEGKTPLLFAAAAGDEAMCAMLLEHKAEARRCSAGW